MTVLVVHLLLDKVLLVVVALILCGLRSNGRRSRVLIVGDIDKVLNDLLVEIQIGSLLLRNLVLFFLSVNVTGTRFPLEVSSYILTCIETADIFPTCHSVSSNYGGAVMVLLVSYVGSPPVDVPSPTLPLWSPIVVPPDLRSNLLAVLLFLQLTVLLVGEILDLQKYSPSWLSVKGDVHVL